jgi:hypothetical protein
MKRVTIFCLALILSGTDLTAAVATWAQSNDAFNAFWQKFKTGVIRGDKKAVAALSKFPIGMSYGIRSIKNNAELSRRFKEVFNQQTNAAQCFSRKEPEKDADNAKRFSVACPNEAGDDVVVYEFEFTRASWKFVKLDNLNE